MPLNDNHDAGQFATGEIFRSPAAAADAFEEYSNPHASRMAAITDQLGKAFNLGPRDRVSLRIAALAHDLGGARTGRADIQRNRPLTAVERPATTQHPL